MTIAIALLKVFVAFLGFAALAGAVEVLANWLQKRQPIRVPDPPLSNDQRIRRYQVNGGAYKLLRQ